MGGYIDIHSHILPCVDDGSKSLEQTKSMLKMAYEEGILTIIVTPHYYEEKGNDSLNQMEKALRDMKENVGFFSNRMTFYLGCEVYYSHESVNLLKAKEIPTMAESRYVLVEFYPMADFQYVRNGLQEFLFGGYIPILAHIERYPNIINDINQVKKLVDMGSYVQVNTMSIVGKSREKQKKEVRRLLKNNLVHFVATDAHSDGMRAPRMKKCAEYLAKKYGEAYMEKILIDNPNKILKNEYL